MVQLLWKRVCEFLEKPTIRLSNCTRRHLSPRDENLMSTQKTCTRLFMAAVFVIAENWKQPTCPSIDEWLNKLWYIHPGSTMWQQPSTRNKVWIQATSWMILKALYWVKKKSVSKGHILYDSFYVTFLKWQNDRDAEQITGGRELEVVGEREVDVTTREIFVITE